MIVASRPSLDEALRRGPGNAPGSCHTLPGDPTIHPCIFGDPEGTATIVAFGDSHAAQWIPSLAALGKRRSWQIIQLSKSGCPSAAVPANLEPTCPIWRGRAVHWIRTRSPDLVLVTNLRSYRLLDHDGDVIPRGALRERAWRAGLERTLSFFAGTVPALVLADTPRMEHDVPKCLKRHMDSIAACQTRRARTMSRAHDRAERAGASAQGATFASMNGRICPYDPCPLIVNELLVWRDTDHLTPTYSRQLSPSLEVIVARRIDPTG
jgi:hypothetical protein